MKVGDEVIYIEDNRYKYSDDVYWDEVKFLIKYKKYTITEIIIHKNEKDVVYLELNNNINLEFNSHRFISTQCYRKLKIENINESRR